ncbi:entericidin A/B family lipoprotein [Deefgea piscis]|nr:entericidin A/B family lipoprotein [Deefgea piscis]QZA79582.1 entericidin A/B family lipoprotein [Deefgea piscis]
MKLFASLLLVLFTLTACNTVSGFGKDLKKVGNEIDKAATK